MDGKTVSNEEKYFEIFEKLKNVGFRKEIQAGFWKTYFHDCAHIDFVPKPWRLCLIENAHPSPSLKLFS